MNLSKFRWGTIAATALAIPFAGQAALAQTQRLCIVDQDSQAVVCGRVATEREISDAGYGRNGSRRHGNARPGNGGRRGGNRYEVRSVSNQRDWSDLYDELDEIYKEVLGRAIDTKGLRTYAKRLDDGWSLAKIRQDVAESDEAERALDGVYRRVLGRGVDPAGFRTYSRKLSRGDSLRDVERDLQRSDEARGR